MEKKVFISMDYDELTMLIIDCMNVCLKSHNKMVAALPPSDLDQLLSIRDAANLLGLTVPTIYGYVHRKEIPVSKRGNRLYFIKGDLMEWVKKGRK